MKIELKEITIRDLTDGYQDNAEEGVVGYGGRLDIRPPYQREFIYREKQRNAVIDTVRKGFPLNVMYWAVREDGTYEVIDGQQRTISICQYVKGDFSFEGRYFHNLLPEEKDKILDYPLMVYACEGTQREKLDWFETINIAGEELTPQELRNAVFAGPWVSDAKRYFSKSNCPARRLANGYVSGSPIRQEYLETAIRWIADVKRDEEIREYMAIHQHDANALALWTYFQSVITWVQGTFIRKRERFMKSVNWGELYNKYKDKGLGIVGVSLDEDKAQWTDAVKSMNMTWTQLSDLQGWHNSAVQMYGIQAIPFTIIVDKEGIVLEAGLRGEELDMYISSKLEK